MDASDQLQARLRQANYIADDTIATALQLSIDLERPLLLEGEAGVGKTEIAKALAEILDTRLIRLQCYEGLDASSAIYEWNYQRQLLSIRAHESTGASLDTVEEHIFSEAFLLPRPLLMAIREPVPPVLLIDEIDRADPEFEAFLLEILSDFQISIPELGTQKAVSKPHVILTSNGTRELSDALRRRCLYAYVDYPSLEREVQIILARNPQVDAEFAAAAARFVQALRKEDLEKIPGVAETLDWVMALAKLGVTDFAGDLAKVQSSLVCLLKTEGDRAAIAPEVTSRLCGKAA